MIIGPVAQSGRAPPLHVPLSGAKNGGGLGFKSAFCARIGWPEPNQAGYES